MFDKLILVDASYTTFYRFFATIRWFSFAKKDEWKKLKEDSEYDWSMNKVFFEKYKKMYLESIIKVIGKRKIKNSLIIFCLDSKQSTLWRNKIMENYKGNRSDLSKKRNYKTVFEITYQDIIPNLVKQNDYIFSLKIPTVEADDIAAVLTKYFEKNKKDLPIHIISGDEDFKQLGRKNVTFYDYRKSKKPVTLTKEEAQINLLTKILSGDKSDNIKCVSTKKVKLTKKIKLELIESKTSLNKFLKDNKECKKQFEINKKMIDFDFIPKNLQNKIIKKAKKIITLF